jgi:hypothetical protein
MWKKLGNEKLKTTIPIADYNRSKQLGNLTHFKHLGNIITYDARSTHEIKPWTAMAKEAVNKKTLFTSKMD